MGSWELLVGDSLTHLRTLADNSVDAVVTDPPAGIAFMGREWDKDKGGRHQWIAWLAAIMGECRRVLKPGGHALVWALPRTSHWTGSALEDAGFEVRDCLVHHFGSGFPKSHAIGKAIDRLKGAARSVVGTWVPTGNARIVGGRGKVAAAVTESERAAIETRSELPITAPATPEAAQWEGWGSALKPASEHWWLCRKPLDGTLAENVLEWGTGGLNVDGCRVSGGVPRWPKNRSYAVSHREPGGRGVSQPTGEPPAGRWPANLLLSHLPECGEADCADGCAVRELDRQSGVSKTPTSVTRGVGGQHGRYRPIGAQRDVLSYGDTGGASRFFPVFRYQAKPSRREREAGLTTGNTHPTVKSVELMRWLVRLITPPGGRVLDPFAGSGSTGMAALYEGATFLGIELLEEHAAIARGRLAYAEREAARPVKVRTPRAAKTARPAASAPAPVQLRLFDTGGGQ